MEVRYMTLIFTWINIALIVAILVGIFKGIKELKKHISRTKQIDKKLNSILEQSDENKK